MDQRMRELERRARAGDQADIDALIRARLQSGDTKEEAICYLQGHVRFEWWYGPRTSQEMADRIQKEQMDWRICLRCRYMEQKFYTPRWVAASACTTLTISTETASNGPSNFNYTVPFTSDAPQVEPTRTSRGSRYAHPTKKRAWRERARLSKRELKRRKAKHR